MKLQGRTKQFKKPVGSVLIENYPKQSSSMRLNAER